MLAGDAGNNRARAALLAAQAAVQAAAVETAWNVVWIAARNAALDAVRAATNDADAITKGDALAAAKDAANKALAPTVEWLQSSAVDLVRRMIEVQYGASQRSGAGVTLS